jgi:hypothetical protein
MQTDRRLHELHKPLKGHHLVSRISKPPQTRACLEMARTRACAQHLEVCSHMDVAYVSALSALAGSVVGSLTSGFTTWLSQRAQARAGRLAHEMSRREELFKDFIVAASKAHGEAIVSNEPKLEELIALYSMVSEMRVMSLPRTVECADQVMRATIDTYFAPNKTIRELHELVQSGTGIDPLKDFSEAAREELHAFALP